MCKISTSLPQFFLLFSYLSIYSLLDFNMVTIISRKAFPKIKFMIYFIISYLVFYSDEIFFEIRALQWKIRCSHLQVSLWHYRIKTSSSLINSIHLSPKPPVAQWSYLVPQITLSKLVTAVPKVPPTTPLVLPSSCIHVDLNVEFNIVLDVELNQLLDIDFEIVILF